MIPLQDCKHGVVYRIHSRNLLYGVFDQEKKGFVGIREKFEQRYLFVELHCDTGAPHGTVSPNEEIEVCPLKDLREGWFVCPACTKPVRYSEVSADRFHEDNTPMCPDVYVGHWMN